ncbi:MAG: hypothetical protein IJP38_05530 [Oscillospiraceae bacterium]|nr:hypothetical protein [Oscillospiraceae bacterium]
MKRFLSIILAVAMLISLVPSVFAVVDEETGLNTLTYNFNYGTLGLTADEETALGDNTLTLAWIKTNRTWVVGTDVYPTDAWTVKNVSGFNSTQATKNEFKLVGTKNKGNSYLLLSVRVDETGVYIPTIKQNIPGEGRRGKYNVYFFSATDLENNNLNESSACSDIAAVMTAANGENPIDVKTAPDKTEIQFGEYVVSEKTDDIAQYVLFEVYPSPLGTGKSDDQAWISALTLEKIAEIEVEEPEPEPEPEPDDGSIKYEFNYASIGREGEDISSVTIGPEDTAESKGSNWEYVYTDLNTRAIYKTFFKLTASSDEVSGQPLTEGIQLKITVPESGTYTPSVNYQKLARGGHLKIYISDKAIAASDITEKGFSGAYKDLTPLDDKYINASEGVDDWNVCEYNNVTLNAGANYLTFVIDGTSVDQSVSKWNKPQAHIENFTLTPVEGGLDGSVTFFADANIEGGNISANIAYNQGDIGSVARGKYVRVTANPVSGYTFRGWVRGSEDNGIWVSSEAEYSFTAMTHTMLTAIYEADAEGDVVEYYNENGTYLETKAVGEEAPVAPALVGYTFDDWYVNNDTLLSDAVLGALTRAVAKHEVKTDEFNVTVEDGIDVSVDGAYIYDKEVTLTASKEVYWLRDEKVVDFGKTYTFNVWGNTSITTSETGNNLPKIVLDKVVKGDARMIEYDDAGYEIVEVGIIFGDDSSIEIGSCKEKMVSQRDLSHGQFTASSDYSAARGYIIYKNINGGLGVIYAD